MAETAAANRPFPALIVRAIGVWVLAGALFKLLAGTPADLPAIVREVPLALGLVYKLVIAIELCIVLAAFLKPRLAWPVTLLLLLVFDGILTAQMAAGSENCGCFGSNVTMPPWVMLAIDTALLVLLLASRPWSGLRRRGAPLPLLLVLCAGAAALPWILDREVTAPRAPAAAARPAQGGAAPEPADGAAAGAAAAEDGSGAPAAERSSAPSYAILTPTDWIGQSLFDTELYGWLPEGTVEGYPPNATWILYRESCDHCAEHLEELALEDDSTTFYVIVQVPEVHEQSPAVHMKPTGPHVFETSLPEGVDYVITTPADFTVEEYVVTAARDEIPLHEH